MHVGAPSMTNNEKPWNDIPNYKGDRFTRYLGFCIMALMFGCLIGLATTGYGAA